MKRQQYLLRVLPLFLAVGLLAGLAWGLQSVRSAFAQSIEDISPVAYAGADQAVSINAMVTLDGSGSYDPDNELPLSYLWAQTGGPVVTFNPALSVTTFTAPSIPTVLTFTLTVTDSTGLADPTPDETEIRVHGQPVANDDSGVGFITDEDTPFITADVLDNDTDPGGGSPSVQSFDASGTLGLVSLAGPAGSLDTSGFGAPDGYVTIDFGGYSEDYAQAVAVQADSKMVVAGSTFMGITENDFALARYNGDGGTFTYDPNGQFDDLADSEWSEAPLAVCF